MKFSHRVYFGLFAGVIFGGILQVVLGVGNNSLTTSLEWIQIVGSGYVHLLQMLVMPIVFVSIVGVFIRMKKSNKIGKISAYVLFVLLSKTAIAATIGVLMVLVFHLDGAAFTKGLKKQHELPS